MYTRRSWSPIWGAFMSTAVSAGYLVAGFSGYHLNRRTRFLAADAWTGSVIWWQVAVGAALIPVALYFWRRGAREIDHRVAAERDSRRSKTATD